VWPDLKHDEMCSSPLGLIDHAGMITQSHLLGLIDHAGMITGLFAHDSARCYITYISSEISENLVSYIT